MKLFRNFMSVVFLSLTWMLLAGVSYSRTAAGNQVNPIPFANAPLLPDSAAPGGPDFKLTLNGTGFVATSVIQWNGKALTTTFVTGSQLSAVVPAANISVAAMASVSVTSPGPGGGTSNTLLFDVREPFSSASFGAAPLSVTTGPSYPVSADFNGDLKTDLAFVASGDSAITILLNAGNGTFQSPVEYPIAANPEGLVVADFNNDGNLDLAVSDHDGFVSVLLGNGDGTFQAKKDSNSAPFALGLAAGDFNGDGKLDLAVAISNPKAQVLVLLGNGDGSFQSPVSYDVGSSRATDVVVGDFNEDGKLDLAVTVFLDNAVSVLLGKGDGTFENGIQYATQTGPGSAIAADFNNDGKLDLAVQTELGGWVSILLGHGDGTFASHADFLTGVGIYGLQAIDLNADGQLDLVMPNYSARKPSTVSTFLGKGDGTFVNRSDFPVGRGSEGIAVGDFNDDGRTDVVTANSVDNTISILPQVTAVLSQTYLKFGKIKLGDSSQRKVVLTNIGHERLKVKHIKLTGSGSEAFSETDNCPTEIAPGVACKIVITFRPTSAVSYRHVRAKIDDSVSIQLLYLHGTGIR